MYSNCFEIVSTVVFNLAFYPRKPDSFEVRMFMFNTVILYHYTINNDYTRYNI